MSRLPGPHNASQTVIPSGDDIRTRRAPPDASSPTPNATSAASTSADAPKSAIAPRPARLRRPHILFLTPHQPRVCVQRLESKSRRRRAPPRRGLVTAGARSARVRAARLRRAQRTLRARGGARAHGGLAGARGMPARASADELRCALARECEEGEGRVRCEAKEKDKRVGALRMELAGAMDAEWGLRGRYRALSGRVEGLSGDVAGLLREKEVLGGAGHDPARSGAGLPRRGGARGRAAPLRWRASTSRLQETITDAPGPTELPRTHEIYHHPATHRTAVTDVRVLALRPCAGGLAARALGLHTLRIRRPRARRGAESRRSSGQRAPARGVGVGRVKEPQRINRSRRALGASVGGRERLKATQRIRIRIRNPPRLHAVHPRAARERGGRAVRLGLGASVRRVRAQRINRWSRKKTASALGGADGADGEPVRSPRSAAHLNESRFATKVNRTTLRTAKKSTEEKTKTKPRRKTKMRLVETNSNFFSSSFDCVFM
ncbi:hypothetical protein FB451DRAFT_1364509 [Mycena latifolia]|nr:hypothetical protein FB451DRAFT_1364509 [Mycena latifolia]